VDGSHSSLAALAWAYQQAETTGCSLDVVGAWGFPVYLGVAGAWPTEFDPEAIVRHQLLTAIERVVPKPTPVPVRIVVRQASPAGALLQEARGANLLVVGTRGHSELTEMLLGSVSLHCVAHSACPVVVVRG